MKELGGVRLDAQIAEKGISSTHVTGYVSPKLKGLDLSIRADSTNLGFLQPFIEGIFSEIKWPCQRKCPFIWRFQAFGSGR